MAVPTVTSSSTLHAKFKKSIEKYNPKVLLWRLQKDTMPIRSLVVAKSKLGSSFFPALQLAMRYGKGAQAPTDLKSLKISTESGAPVRWSLRSFPIAHRELEGREKGAL